MATILIVDDDADLRLMYRITLAQAGYRVLEARDGVQALHLLSADPPDLVVLDLGLPRMSGYIVRQEIAAGARTRDVPVIVVTGMEAPPPERLKVASLLHKPVSPDLLVDTVAECLKARDRSDSR